MADIPFTTPIYPVEVQSQLDAAASQAEKDRAIAEYMRSLNASSPYAVPQEPLTEDTVPLVDVGAPSILSGVAQKETTPVADSTIPRADSALPDKFVSLGAPMTLGGPDAPALPPQSGLTVIKGTRGAPGKLASEVAALREGRKESAAAFQAGGETLAPRKDVAGAPGASDAIRISELKQTIGEIEKKPLNARTASDNALLTTAANELSTLAGRQQAKQEAAVYEGYADEQAAQTERYTKEREVAQGKVETATQRLDELRREYDKGEIDPSRFWGEGWSKVLKVALAAFASGLTAYGAALTGTKDSSAGIIDAAIQRDIDAQKAALARKGKAAQRQESVLARLYAEYGNIEAAEKATKALMRQELGVKLQAAAAKTKDQNVAARGAQISAKLANQASTDLRDFQSQVYNQELKDIQVQARLEQQASQHVAATTQVLGEAPHKKGKPISDKQAAEYYGLSATARDLNRLTSALVKLERDSSGALLRVISKHIPDTDASRLSSARSRYASQYLKALSGATATEDEFNRLSGQLPAVDATAETNIARYNDQYDAMLNSLRGKIDAADDQGKDTTKMRKNYDTQLKNRINFTEAPNLAQ